MSQMRNSQGSSTGRRLEVSHTWLPKSEKLRLCKQGLLPKVQRAEADGGWRPCRRLRGRLCGWRQGWRRQLFRWSPCWQRRLFPACTCVPTSPHGTDDETEPCHPPGARLGADGRQGGGCGRLAVPKRRLPESSQRSFRQQVFVPEMWSCEARAAIPRRWVWWARPRPVWHARRAAGRLGLSQCGLREQ